MFSSLKLESQWHAEDGDKPVCEPAEICALYMVMGENRQGDFVEIESELYIDDRNMSLDLYREILKNKNELKQIEVHVAFYRIAVSFMKSHTHDGIKLVEGAYSKAMDNHVSPIQPIRSIEIFEIFFESEKAIYNQINRLPAILKTPTAIDLIAKKIGSVQIS